MARVDELVKQVGDERLRGELEQAVKKLRKGREFGLVFEEHVPEVIALPGLPLRVGGWAQMPDFSLRRIVSLDGDTAEVRGGGGAGAETDATETVDASDLTPVARFGESIYPTLDHLGSVERGDPDAPHHMVIDSENYHALQLLLHLYAGQVDCIYIDPPYNTGDKDWKYNNNYVDDRDAYRHSKWLSMMEKRLRLAKKLLSPDGFLVIAIDENEVHHLSLLLEMNFKEAVIQMITYVRNSVGIHFKYLSSVEEHLLLCGFGQAELSEISDDYLTDQSNKSTYNPWISLKKGGPNSDPSDRPNLVYPIGVDPQTSRIIGTGISLGERIENGMVWFNRSDADFINNWQPSTGETVDGFLAIWPQRSDGSLGNWRISAKSPRK